MGRTLISATLLQLRPWIVCKSQTSEPLPEGYSGAWWPDNIQVVIYAYLSFGQRPEKQLQNLRNNFLGFTISQIWLYFLESSCAFCSSISGSYCFLFWHNCPALPIARKVDKYQNPLSESIDIEPVADLYNLTNATIAKQSITALQEGGPHKNPFVL